MTKKEFIQCLGEKERKQLNDKETMELISFISKRKDIDDFGKVYNIQSFLLGYFKVKDCI